jgi:hypothetical protein
LLTKYFLDEKHKFIAELPTKNTLGTENARFAMAYAKTIFEMWYHDATVVIPRMFKKILGETAL